MWLITLLEILRWAGIIFVALVVVGVPYMLGFRRGYNVCADYYEDWNANKTRVWDEYHKAASERARARRQERLAKPGGRYPKDLAQDGEYQRALLEQGAKEKS